MLVRFRFASPFLFFAFALLALPAIRGDAKGAQLSTASDPLIDRVAAREQQEISTFAQFRPLAEVYVQDLQSRGASAPAPVSDRYLLGRADFSKATINPLVASALGNSNGASFSNGPLAHLFQPFHSSYSPQTLLGMVFLDDSNFDRDHYHFTYVTKEFLGEIECLVFDVAPLPKAGSGSFQGRIWVENSTFTIVRFKGVKTPGATHSAFEGEIDSWRANLVPGLWLPVSISARSGNSSGAGATQNLQLQFWGYDPAVSPRGVIPGEIPPSGAEERRTRAVEDAVLLRLQSEGLVAPAGDVDKLLDQVIGNIAIANGLPEEPLRCTILLSSTLELFSIGRTIVISRGLLDVIPDESALTAVIARQIAGMIAGESSATLAGVKTGQDVSTLEILRSLPPPNAALSSAADAKALELLQKYPFTSGLAQAQSFLKQLALKQKPLASLIDPDLAARAHFLDSLPASLADSASGNPISFSALPMGSRVRIDQWSDAVSIVKSAPVADTQEIADKSFQIRPTPPRLSVATQPASIHYLTVSDSPVEMAASNDSPSPTVALQAMPETVRKGESVTLTWDSTNATSVSIDPGIGSVALQGSTQVSLNDSTTYTITASGPGGSTQQSVEITVLAVSVASPDAPNKGDRPITAGSATQASTQPPPPDTTSTGIGGLPAVSNQQTPPPAGTETSIERYPGIDAPSSVRPRQDFAVTVLLTERKLAMQTRVESPLKTPSGALKIPAPTTPNQKSNIDVALSAPGFEFTRGSNIGQLVLAAAGDAQPAVFWLRPAADTPAGPVDLMATLWSQGNYLGSISRTITIGTSQPQAPQTPASSPAASVGVSQAAPPAAPVEQPAGVPMIDVNPSPLNADLSIMIRQRGVGDGKMEVVVVAPPDPPVAVTVDLPAQTQRWLALQYRELAIRSSKAAQNSESGSPGADDFFRGFGRELWNQFAPDVVKTAFWKLVDQRGARFRSIWIVSDDPTVPWELMRPQRGTAERDYLGLDFRIARWVTSADPSALQKPPQRDTLGGVYVVAPNYGPSLALPGQQRELTALDGLHAHRIQPGNLLAVHDLAQQWPAGLIHFSGHGVIAPDQGFANYEIVLEDGVLDLTTWRGMVNAQAESHPFFFFNACEVGSAGVTLNFVDGWAPELLREGASGYIGALWPVNDQIASDLAAEFYKQLETRSQSGYVPIAEVLLHAKRAIYQKTHAATPLGYVFYGDPNQELKLPAH